MNRIPTNRKLTLFLVLFLAAGVTLTGCSNVNKAGKGAGIGAGAGAVIGGVIGATQDDTGKGAIIGAVVGGTAGAIIGAQMDKQAEELEQELEDVQIERVGEGIQVTFDSAILFDFNSSNVSSESAVNLGKLATSLQEYPNTDVVVIGHTDATGAEEYNQSLSERRAKAAADVLLAKGVDHARVTTVGKGELEPVASNDTADGRQLNRRVEIAIFANEEYRQELEEQQANN